MGGGPANGNGPASEHAHGHFVHHESGVATPPRVKWWKEAAIYQIYPASFKDNDGDGLGDFPGIIDKLDYIRDLGVDCVWICPFYKSPQYDLGYDIEDYQDVHGPYGKLEHVDAIIKGCHERGMKIIFDLVVNHSSSHHRWFKESRSSKDNPKRDWYMWKPPRYINGERHPPNNWKAVFGGSVWEWDELTQEYYLHYFVPEQPDFNWENPETREAIYQEAVVFWLKKGVDGFRIDTVNMYSKYLDFPDAPVVDPHTPWQPAGHFFSNGPRIHEFINEMNRKAFQDFDAVSIGELPETPDFRDVLHFVSAKAEELDMVIQFDLANLDHGGAINLLYHPWKLSDFKKITWNAQQLTDPQYDGWVPVTCLENHDLARCVTRFGNDSPEFRVPSAKMLATYLLTLSGTPIIYQGQEIGMINIPKDWDIDQEYIDCGTIGFMKEVRFAAEEDPSIMEKGILGAHMLARDHARTPMQWTSQAPHAGFSTAAKGKTWMRVNDSFATINVEQQEKDGDSVLAFYRKLLRLRKQHKDLVVHGLYETVDVGGEHTFVYIKRSTKDSKKALVVALNFTKDRQPFEVPATAGKVRLELSNLDGETAKENELRPYESRVYLTAL